jgi:hypothetical protein
MTWTMVEGAVSAIRTYMRANYATKLLALDALYNDGIILDPPVTLVEADGPVWLVGEQASLEAIQGYPVGILLGGDTTVGYWNNTNTEGSHEVMLVILAQDQDPEVLRKKLYRYRRALWECLVDAHFASSLSGFRILGSPVLSSSPVLVNGSMAVGESRVTVNVHQQETR